MRATGLSVRFFRVTIPFGKRAGDSSTGSTLSSDRFVGTLRVEPVKIARKRPVATRFIRAWLESVTTVVRGYSSPRARKPSIAIDMIPLPGGGSTHGSLTSSPSALALRASSNDTHVIKKKLEVHPFLVNGTESSCNQEVDVTLSKLRQQCLGISGHKMNFDARISSGQPIDDNRGE